MSATVSLLMYSPNMVTGAHSNIHRGSAMSGLLLGSDDNMGKSA